MITYEESAALMTDIAFRGKVKVACLKFADYILNEPVATPAHNTRIKWAQSVQAQPDMTAMTVQPPTVMDAAVQTAGAAIADVDLQSAVETTVNRLL